MIGAIAGDIIGSRFEGHPAPPAGFDLFHHHCRFTDDTVCSLAVAEAVIGRRDFARHLRALVRRHPERGYGGMFLRWAYDEGMPAYGSWGNGAPMRVAAIGWLATDADEVDALARAQAEVSHDHPDAIAGAVAVARTILALRQGVETEEVRTWLMTEFGYDLRPEAALVGGRFDVSAKGTVPPALVAAFESDSWEHAVRTAVMLGGDTDTLACICGAVAEAIHGVPPEIAAAARAHLTEDLREALDRFEARRSGMSPSAGRAGLEGSG